MKAKKNQTSFSQKVADDKTKVGSPKFATQVAQDEAVYPLGKTNIKLIGISFLVIIVGFLLMIGGGSTPENHNPDIFSFRRLILGPGIAFIGFVFMAFAIIYKKKEEPGEDA